MHTVSLLMLNLSSVVSLKFNFLQCRLIYDAIIYNNNHNARFLVSNVWTLTHQDESC